MLKQFLNWQLSLTEKGKPLHKLRPLIQAGDTFLFEAPVLTKTAPHIRDAIDVKRWMLVVVFALLPCLLFAIWNTGLQTFVYGSSDIKLLNDYLESSLSLGSYLDFSLKDGRYLTILGLGLKAILPLLLISYVVGGFWEALFACLRGHEISEGFLVTGILYVLILPSTIPYWMAAVGVSAGVVLGKEVFGGSGMNIVNPALACRAFLFFTFPGKMSGEIWAGTNPTTIRKSLVKINQEAQAGGFEGYTQATKLAEFNVTQEIKRIHVDAIATNDLGQQVSSFPAIEKSFEIWKGFSNTKGELGKLSKEELYQFVTGPLNEGGLGLSPGYFEDASHFSALNFGMGHNSDFSFFFGDKLGCIGETSVLACLLGAAILIYTGVGSWRTMLAMTLGAFLTAFLFEYTPLLFQDGGAFLPAQFGFPAYKHLLLGGLAFGIVFMATDPVSSPCLKGAKWVYGFFCGIITIIIRVINPAYPEGVMLAILMGNVFAPLFDYVGLRIFMKRSASLVRAQN